MKPITLMGGAAALVATVAFSPVANAQTVVTTSEDRPAVVATTTTTRVGRVGTVTPDTLMMDASAGTEPIRYLRTSRTVYVDETGAPISADLVRTGAPVTVHYTRDADRYLADRVVVRRQTVVSPEPTVVEKRAVVEPVRRPVVVEKKTTTTTESVPAKVKVKDVDDDD
jgi:hypothetical protein